jgi:hypothetical protein
VYTPLNVDAVREALQSLPKDWKRLVNVVPYGPHDSMLMDLEKALALPDFVTLAQDFLASFHRAHPEGRATATNVCYWLLCCVNDVSTGWLPMIHFSSCF